MSLPTAWVDKIFEKMTLTYGRDFLGRWVGLDENQVKSDWAHELSGLFANPSCIAFALQNLPERAPTVIEFRRIARSMPDAPALPVEYSRAGQERIRAELAKLAPVVAPRSEHDGKQWARDIIARDLQGIRSKSSLPLHMARAALAERSIFAGAAA